MTMDFIQVGKILNTHGVKGELKVLPLTHNIDRFDQLRDIFIGNKYRAAEIETVRYHKNLAIIKLRGFDNINQVLSFKDMYISIREADKIDLPEGHYFIFDIVHCQVFDKDGNYIGLVEDVDQSASNDIYIVKNPEHGKEYLIPAVKEIVTDIDIQEKKIIIAPIEGLIE